MPSGCCGKVVWVSLFALVLRSQRFDGGHDAFGDLIVFGFAFGGFHLLGTESDGWADADRDA